MGGGCRTAQKKVAVDSLSIPRCSGRGGKSRFGASLSHQAMNQKEGSIYWPWMGTWVPAHCDLWFGMSSCCFISLFCFVSLKSW